MGARGLKKFPAALCLALLFFPLALTANQALLTSLPPAVADLLKKHKVPADSLSVFVQDVNSARPFLLFNADTARNPASTIKILTTYVALEQLGPAFTWKTQAYLNGALSQGRLNGDLILKGYGDPLLTTEALWVFLRRLRTKGLQHISGDLVLDTRYFAADDTDPGAFDGHRFEPYNALPNALLVNFQAIEFHFFPQAKSVRIAAEPEPVNLIIDNQLKLSGGKCSRRRIGMDVQSGADAATVTFTGTYPQSCGSFAMHRVVMNPHALAYGVFKSLWQQLGGTFKGRLRLGNAPAKAKPFYTMRSRPLAELIRSMNKHSNNVMTRHLLLTLGAERFGEPGSLGKGRVAIQEWLDANQLQTPQLVIDNGAGLSRTARISARGLGNILLKASRSPYRGEMIASLPIAAVDGTMRRRFRGEALAGRMHLKTGTLNDSKAIAGYVLSRSGKTFVVVSLHNYPNIGKRAGTAAQNELLRWLFEQ